MSEFKFGEGRISGILSITLGLMCVAGVIGFHFPQVFSTPEVREAISVDWLRKILAFFIFMSLLLSITSFLLSKKKTLSLFGFGLVVFAEILGGSRVQVPDALNQDLYIGLDWFLLDLLIVGLIFIPIERIFARISNQKVFRNGWKTDLFHFGISHLLVQLTTAIILTPSLMLSGIISVPAIREAVRSQPVWLQFLEIVLIADFFQYWVHRTFHKVPTLWRIHAIHHSSREMDWLAGSRLHLVDIVATRGLVLLPIFFLGFADAPMKAYLVFVAFLATFIHLNIKYKFDWISEIVATPIFHHWHHAIEDEAIDKNFAVHLPVLDKIFGTYYLPEDKWPSGYGIKDASVPVNDYVAQTVYPFKKKSPG